MEAGSTIEQLEIQTNFDKVCTGPLQVDVILASSSCILHFPIQCELCAKVLGNPTCTCEKVIAGTPLVVVTVSSNVTYFSVFHWVCI